MKYLLCLPALFLCSLLIGQSNIVNSPSEKVILDNHKVKVIEFTSQPQEDICGAGMHYHEPHLTVVLTDVKIQITSENGNSQDVEVESGTSMWLESETHSVINKGNKLARVLLVFLKE